MINEGKFKAGGHKPQPESSTRPPPPKPANPKSIAESCESIVKNVKVSTVINSKDYEPWYTKGSYTAHHSNGEGFVNFSDAQSFCEELPNIHVFMHDSGMMATHNMPCPVCKTNHAVFVSSEGYFDACRKCQVDGWYVGKRKMVNDQPKKRWEFWK